MSDASGPIKIQSPPSALTDLTLSVRIDGASEQEVFLQHGLSVGRNPSNTICINEPDIERIHAMVQRQSDGSMVLECTDEHLRLALADGALVHSIPLKPGVTFKLGKAVIRCLKRETKPTIYVSDNPWVVRCPRCHDVIAQLPRDTKNCPQCALDIQYFQSDPGAAGTGGPETFRATSAFEGWLPREVGPYKIRAFIAQGGMGIILRGLHKDLDLPAAVKLLKIDSDDDPSWRQRFVAEIDTLKELRHPNVVHLQGNGQDDKLIWLAMDWIDGQPLTKLAATHRAQNKPIPIDEIASILSQVVTGLTYLHTKQIIHRDLKPSNILMANDGGVKMVDFGIAKAASGQTAVMTQLTHTGMVAGTESYMSPEQGEGQNLTPASDIYSLGVMWYELVTGRRPVGAFAAPHLVRPDCPIAWSNSISQCLSTEPRLRPSLASIEHTLNDRSAGPPPIPAHSHTGLIPSSPQNTWVPPRATEPSHPHLPPIIHNPPVRPEPFRPEPPRTDPNAPKVADHVKKFTNTAVTQVQTFLQKNPPSAALAKMGPLGDWIKSHKGPSTAIGAGIFLIVLVLSIRSCSSPAKPTTPAATNNPAPAPAQNEPTRNNNDDNPLVHNLPNNLPQLSPQQMYFSGYALIQQANDVTDPRFVQGFDLLTKSANAGNTQAMYALGAIHNNPQLGSYYNRNQGIDWLRRGARAGDQQCAGILRQYGIPF